MSLAWCAPKTGTEYLLHLIIILADSIYSGYSMGKSLYSPKSANILWSLSSLLLHLSKQWHKWKYYIIFHLIVSQNDFLHSVFFSPWFPLCFKKTQQTKKPTQFLTALKFLEDYLKCQTSPSPWPGNSLLFPPYGLGNLVRVRADTEFKQLLKVLNNLQWTLEVKWQGRGRMKCTSKVPVKSWSGAPYFSDQLIRWYVFKCKIHST